MEITCKHCGSQDGFYTQERVSGITTIWYTKNGDLESEQGDMYQNLNHSGGKKAYCQKCEKYMGKSEQLISGNNERGKGFFMDFE